MAPGEDCNPVCARHDERLKSLEAYEEKQNSSLERLEEKVDALKMWMLGASVSAFGGGVLVALLKK